ncbi:MAG: ACT domain-containing protein [Oscillospiraceae bacterium]|nr:ACT domain-containing protein [Oscillospiraceae bacterium]
MVIKQLSVFVENKIGRMAEITGIIGDANVDIRALSIADTSDFGILRLIVDKPEEALLALKENKITVSLTDVIAVGIEDKPGAFAKVVKIMSDAGISIEYMYAFISRSDDQAFVIMRVEDPDKGIAALNGQGIKLLCREDIY